MPTFAVWAPRPERVELRLGETCVLMDRGRDGWWRARVPAFGPGAGGPGGARYGFCLDGGKPLPDPRSGFQPDGVDGLSQIVDHDPFAWSDHGWRGVSARGLVLYELHDQVGNRALGDRSGALMSPGRLKVAAALMLTGPFTPMLFQGEEWAAGSPFQYFTDHGDPELARAVSEGRRREFADFGWRPDQVPDPQDLDTFTRSKLDWDEVGCSLHADVLGWYRRLMELRRARPALSDPRLDRISIDADEASGTIVVRRGPISILVNLGQHYHWFPVGSGDIVLAVSDSRTDGQHGGLLVPPDGVVLTESPASEP